MNIELKKEQYLTLLKIMYCGEWVLNSYKTKEDKIYKESDELEQIIFSFAKELKLEKWIDYDESVEKYFPTILLEETGSMFLDKYIEKQRRL